MVTGVPIFLTDSEYRVLRCACDRMFPATAHNPGADALGVADYIDGLLGAFHFDPPRIWAGGPYSGRHGGADRFATFHRLGPLDELAWRTRLEGSCGMPEREFNGPVVGYQERYRSGLARLGEHFPEASWEEKRLRLEADPDFCEMVFHHGCEGMYGAPEYGGNRNCGGWEAAGYTGDVQPRGWSDSEVSLP